MSTFSPMLSPPSPCLLVILTTSISGGRYKYLLNLDGPFVVLEIYLLSLVWVFKCAVVWILCWLECGKLVTLCECYWTWEVLLGQLEYCNYFCRAISRCSNVLLCAFMLEMC
jgi:hypothetical protein